MNRLSTYLSPGSAQLASTREGDSETPSVPASTEAGNQDIEDMLKSTPPSTASAAPTVETRDASQLSLLEYSDNHVESRYPSSSGDSSLLSSGNSGMPGQILAGA